MYKIFVADIIFSNRSFITNTVSPNGFSKRENFRRNRKAKFTVLYNFFDSDINIVNVRTFYNIYHLFIYDDCLSFTFFGHSVFFIFEFTFIGSVLNNVKKIVGNDFH